MVVETGVNDEDWSTALSIIVVLRQMTTAQAMISETTSDDMDINAGQRMLIVLYCSSRVHVLHFNTACNMYFVGVVQLLMVEKEIKFPSFSIKAVCIAVSPCP